MVVLTQDNLKTEITDFKGISLVLFTNRSDLEDIKAQEYINTRQGIKLCVVYFDDNRELVHKFVIRRLPTYLLIRDGQIWQTVYSLEEFKKKCGTVDVF